MARRPLEATAVPFSPDLQGLQRVQFDNALHSAPQADSIYQPVSLQMRPNSTRGSAHLRRGPSNASSVPPSAPSHAAANASENGRDRGRGGRGRNRGASSSIHAAGVVPAASAHELAPQGGAPRPTLVGTDSERGVGQRGGGPVPAQVRGRGRGGRGRGVGAGISRPETQSPPVQGGGDSAYAGAPIGAAPPMYPPVVGGVEDRGNASLSRGGGGGRGRGASRPRMSSMRAGAGGLTAHAAAAADGQVGSLAEVMSSELRSGAYECSICFDVVRPADTIWSCDTCFRVLHGACARQWRETSRATAAAAAAASGDGGGGAAPLASGGREGRYGRDGREATEGRAAREARDRERGAGLQSLTGSWKCPGCRAEQHTAPADRCFCAKVRRPDLQPYLTPHSCGEVCGKARGSGCPHRCEAVCHPGPCAPCSAMGPSRHCGCGHSTFRLRCGAPEREVAARMSCGQPCGKPFPCGIKAHKCTRPCHALTISCGGCDKKMLQSCYCGHTRAMRTCGTGYRAPSSSFLRARDAGALGPCIEAPLTVTHTEVGTEIGPDGVGQRMDVTVSVALPLQPDLYTTGAGVEGDDETALAALIVQMHGTDTSFSARDVLAAAQAAAMENVRAAPPTLERERKRQVQAICSERISGDHDHDPSSGHTEVRVTATAPAAGRHMPTAGYFSCGMTCNAWLDCGLHRCTSPCHSGDCDGCPLLPGRLRTCACGKSRMEERSAARLSCVDPMYTCADMCGKGRPCGHACESLCHAGACPPCNLAVERVACRCGSTVVEPPSEKERKGNRGKGSWFEELDAETGPKGGVDPPSSSSSSSHTIPTLTCGALYTLAANGGDLQGWQKARQAATAALKRSEWGDFTAVVLAMQTLTEPMAGAPLPVDQLRQYPIEVVTALLRCRRGCGRQLRCGRHHCMRSCCGLYRAPEPSNNPDGAADAQARADSLDMLVSELRTRLNGDVACGAVGEEEGGVQAPGHSCVRECGRPLACGKHPCKDTCHGGACGPCGAVDMRAMSCTCGRVRVEPPVRCGAVLPKCGAQCSVPQPCGHPPRHMCHTSPAPPAAGCGPLPGPCPPCLTLTSRACAGGHETRAGIPCHVAEVTCHRQCGKALPCGEHTCARLCHSGLCEGSEVRAGMERAHAAHVIARAAHVDAALDRLRELLPLAAGRKAIPFDVVQLRDPATVLVVACIEQALAQGGPLPSEGGLADTAAAQFDRLAQEGGSLLVACGQRCNRARALCPHLCTSLCHPSTACPLLPCKEVATILCGCGRLAVRTPCMHGAGPAGSDTELDLAARAVPCDELCSSMGRARALGRALGVLDGQGQDGSSLPRWSGTTTGAAEPVNPYPEALLSFARDNPALADKLEKVIRMLVLGAEGKGQGQGESASDRVGRGSTIVAVSALRSGVQDSADTAALSKPARAFVHTLAELWGLNSVSYDPEPRRYVHLTRRAQTGLVMDEAGMGMGDGTGTGGVNTIPRPGAPSSSGLGMPGTPLSSIGRLLRQGCFILPSLSLAQAVEASRVKSGASRIPLGVPAASSSRPGFASFRLGVGLDTAPTVASFSTPDGSALATAARAAPGSGAYPGEPSLAAMDPAQVGCILFAGGLKRSTRESSLRTFLASYAGDGISFRTNRLDDHSATLVFDTQGSAARALGAAQAGLAKGGADPYGLSGLRLRYWGVGVGAHMLAQSHSHASAGGSALPHRKFAPSSDEADGWETYRGSWGVDKGAGDEYEDGEEVERQWQEVSRPRRTGGTGNGGLDEKAQGGSADAWDTPVPEREEEGSDLMSRSHLLSAVPAPAPPPALRAPILGANWDDDE